MLPRGRERQALPRRPRRALLRQHRLRLRRRDRAGGARADARAALLHQLDVRAPARGRARRGGCLARPRRPQPGLLRLGRLRGGRVRVEARAAVLPRARRQAAPRARWLGARARPRRDRREPAHPDPPLQGDHPADRVPRDDARSALAHRHPGDPRPVRAAPRRGAERPQHEPLPPAGRGDGRGVHGRPARRARADDRGDGAGDRLPRPHGARPELRWLLRRPEGLLARCPRALRPLRHPSLGRRGDHGVRPDRRLVRVGAIRHPTGSDHLGEGALVLVRGDRRRDPQRPGRRAVPLRGRDVLARDHLRRASRAVRGRARRTSRS